MSEQTTAATTATIVERYFAAWNETDPARRQELISTAYGERAGYLDPLFAVEGHAALDAMIAGVHAQYPGYRFHLTDPIDAHHDRARWGWELIGPDGGAPAATGVDFATFDPDGRLREVVGFFNPALAQ